MSASSLGPTARASATHEGTATLTAPFNDPCPSPLPPPSKNSLPAPSRETGVERRVTAL